MFSISERISILLSQPEGIPSSPRSAPSRLPVIAPVEISGVDTAQVLATLARVDETFQAPVALFYLQDCSYKEIAAILDVPLGTVKSRISRGIAQLQKMLAQELRPNQRPDPT